MLRSNLCYYSDSYILVSATITASNTAAQEAAVNNRKNIIIKNCAPFNNCISEINNTQIDNAMDIDIIMQMYNLIEYSGIYSKTSGSLCHYYRDEPFLHDGAIADFPADNDNSASFKFKTKIADKTGNDGTKNVEIRVPLRYLINFWRALKISSINCEINLILTWSDIFFIIDNPIANQEPTFTKTDTKLYVPVLTLSTQAKLLEQLKPGFERTNNWNEYEPKVTVEQQNQFLDFLINPSFLGVNRLFVLLFEDTDGRIYKRY